VWRSDPKFAESSLQQEPAQIIAILTGWSEARLFFDAAHWKPPDAGAIPFHQDNSYMLWTNPPTMNALWLALEDVTLKRGPIIYAKGSHQWPDHELPDYRNRTRNGMSGFLDPINFKHSIEAAAANHGKTPE